MFVFILLLNTKYLTILWKYYILTKLLWSIKYVKIREYNFIILETGTIRARALTNSATTSSNASFEKPYPIHVIYVTSARKEYTYVYQDLFPSGQTETTSFHLLRPWHILFASRTCINEFIHIYRFRVLLTCCSIFFSTSLIWSW